MKRLTLNDIYQDWNKDNPLGFFTYLETWALANEIEIPFFEENSNLSAELDLYYHGNVSGDKIASSFITGLSGGEKITASKAFLIAGAWWSVNGKNVLKEYSLLSLEYNPIENYYLEEESTDTHTGTVDDEHGGTKTVENDGTQDIEYQGSESDGVTNGTVQNDVWAFDSTTPEPANRETTNITNVKSFTNRKDVRTDDLTRTIRDNLTNTRTHDEEMTHSSSRHGNIGVTTAQRMLGSERNLWLWNFFIKFLFPTVDAVLTVPYY